MEWMVILGVIGECQVTRAGRVFQWETIASLECDNRSRSQRLINDSVPPVKPQHHQIEFHSDVNSTSQWPLAPAMNH